MKISNDNNTVCVECDTVKDDVRFEGSYEGFICDNCLSKIKLKKDNN